MVLLVMIDDATSKVVARFYPSEDTQGYMDLLWRYMRKHGRMVALYTDHDSVFCGEGQDRKTPQTQFSRALKELGIEWIAAGSPQAKGRVERFNGTAQDRLVKELRLAKARTIQEANEVLDKRFLQQRPSAIASLDATGVDPEHPAPAPGGQRLHDPVG